MMFFYRLQDNRFQDMLHKRVILNQRDAGLNHLLLKLIGTSGDYNFAHVKDSKIERLIYTQSLILVPEIFCTVKQ
jgi:hypothetical protein